MIKLLYLLAGIMLKQTVDEGKSLIQDHVKALKDQRDSIATYRQNPALQAGSAEAQRAINEHQHMVQVSSDVGQLTKRIKRWAVVPVLVDAVLTLLLIFIIAYLESLTQPTGGAP